MNHAAPTPVPRGSYCGRCSVHIAPEDVPAFIDRDHLCEDCGTVADSEHAQSVVAGEKQKTTREVTA
jgi:hypothetical protein